MSVEGDDTSDALVQTGVDKIHRANHVGLHTFERVVFRGRHNLCRGGMHDTVDAIQCPKQPIFVPSTSPMKNLTRGSPQRVLPSPLLHLITLRVDDEAFWVVLFQRHRNERVAEEPVPPVTESTRRLWHSWSLIAPFGGHFPTFTSAVDG